jgi:metal-responsive CopG/Arc/MetJ family transcriptional regulator
MAHVKTAISLDELLLEQAEALARQLEISRSRLFALAVAAFIERQQNQKLLETIDQAYGSDPDPEEEQWRQRMRSRHRKTVKGQW